MNYYLAFGLQLQSQLNLTPLDCLGSVSDFHETVRIRRAEVATQGLKKPIFKRALTQIKKNQVWFDVPNVARFLVKNGSEVLVDPYPCVDDDTLAVYVLGSCLGAILHQRNFLVLHANAIRTDDDTAVLFVGNSGAGKSTTAALFHKKEYEILSDDIVVIDAKGRVIPGLPYIKLWQSSLVELDIPLDDLVRIRSNINKYRLPVSQPNLCGRPKVKAIYNLKAQTHTAEDALSIQTCAGLNRFKCITNNAYRSDAIIGLGLKAQHLEQCSQIARNVHMMEINRPANYFSAPTMFDMVIEDLKEKQLLYRS